MKYSSKINRILLTMYKSGSVNKNEIPHTVLHSLFQDNYIANSNNYHDTNVYLTDKGKAYVEDLKKTRNLRIHDWVNTSIAAMSLIVAIISLIV